MVKVSGVPYDVELPQSPCVKICKLDPRGYVCLGCYRYVDEIAKWRDLPDTEKRRILEAVEIRRCTYEADWGDQLTKQEWGKHNNCPDGRWDFNQKE